MNRNDILATLKDSSGFLSSEFSVNKIAIFGSAAKEMMHLKSDVDIYVEFRSPIGFRFNRLVQYLESLLGHKVDVLTKEGVNNIRVTKIAEDIKQSMIYV